MVNIKKLVLWGMGFGIPFAIMAFLNIGFIIGTPRILGIAQVGRFMTIVILAPILEEFMFRFIIPTIFYNAIPIARRNWVITSIVSAVIFSIFHVAAYGSLIDQSALFASALVFGFVSMLILRISSNQENPIGYWKWLLITVIAHMIINFAIFAKPLTII